MWIAHTRSQTMVHKLHLKLLFSLLWYRCRVDGFSMSYCDWLLLLHLLLNLLGILCALCVHRLSGVSFPCSRSYCCLFVCVHNLCCFCLSLLNCWFRVCWTAVTCIALVWFCCLLIYWIMGSCESASERLHYPHFKNHEFSSVQWKLIYNKIHCVYVLLISHCSCKRAFKQNVHTSTQTQQHNILNARKPIHKMFFIDYACSLFIPSIPISFSTISLHLWKTDNNTGRILFHLSVLWSPFYVWFYYCNIGLAVATVVFHFGCA